MLLTDLQPLAQFKAILPVLKPSLSMYIHVCTIIVAHTAPRLRVYIRVTCVQRRYIWHSWQQRGTWLCTENVKHRRVLQCIPVWTLSSQREVEHQWSILGKVWTASNSSPSRSCCWRQKSLVLHKKKHGLQQLDLPSLGVKEALVVPVKKNTKV